MQVISYGRKASSRELNLELSRSQSVMYIDAVGKQP